MTAAPMNFTESVILQLNVYGDACVTIGAHIRQANQFLNEGICPMVNCTGNVYQLDYEPGMTCVECRLQFVSDTNGLAVHKREDAK